MDDLAVSFEERLQSIIDEMMAEMTLVESEYLLDDTLDEAARWAIVRARIRNGKVQRRKKISTIPGYTFRKKGGSVVFMRMPTTERIRRRIGQRRAKIKKRGKLARINLKRKRSMRKRAGMGLRA